MDELPSKEGFPMDLRVVGRDEIAYEYAVQWFGQKYLDKVSDNLHRSSVTTEAIFEDLMKYDRKYVGPKVRSDPAYLAVLESVREDFTSKEPLIPLTLGGVFEHPDFPRDKSPGLPWTQRGFKTKGDVLDCSESRGKILRLWDAIGNSRSNVGLPDSCTFFRAQIATTGKEKIRAVWGTPMDVVCEEFRFFKPYITWLEQTNAPIAYRVEMATGGMSYINDMCRRHPNQPMVMTDYSQFDASIPAWLIRDAFQIVFDSFDLTKVIGSDGKTWNVKPHRTNARIRKLIQYFINTPIRMPDGRRFRKSGGVPSGSVFTNIIDTIVNAIVMRYVSYHTTGNLPLAEMYLGDDSFLILRGIVNLKDMSELALESFGMIIHPEKSYVTTNPGNVQFLGYYNRGGLPFKPQAALVASFIYPERRVMSNMIRVARALGQMWSTMHSGLAYNWFCMVQQMMKDFEVSEQDMTEYIESHPNHFRYLRMIGIDPKKVGIPRPSGNVILEVDPPWVSLRNYTPKTYDVQALYDKAVLRYNDRYQE
nr:MAG: putative RNA-dependent RNA polymerase [Partitiviridae sp.]